MTRTTVFFVLILISNLITSCNALTKETVSDRALARILIKEKWSSSTVPSTGISLLTNYKTHGNAVDYYSFYVFEFNKDGTFSFGLSKPRTDFELIRPVKYENTNWKISDHKFHMKAQITSMGYSSKDSTFYEYSMMWNNVYAIDLRNKSSIPDFMIQFNRLDNVSISYYTSNYKTIKKQHRPDKRCAASVLLR